MFNDQGRMGIPQLIIGCSSQNSPMKMVGRPFPNMGIVYMYRHVYIWYAYVSSKSWLWHVISRMVQQYVKLNVKVGYYNLVC